jgi:DNA/RNA endonuclease YhcR with UshA esterase domain
VRHPVSSLLALALLTACSAGRPLAIADARALDVDATATVEGHVTVAPGTFNSSIGDQGFAIQDASAGIYVSVPDGLDFGLGERVRVSGRLAQVAQLTTLIADIDDVEVRSGRMDVAAGTIVTGEIGEANEGRLVEVEGTVTRAIVDDGAYGLKVYVDDGSGEVQVFVHIVEGAPVIDLSLLEVGQRIRVVGLSAQYEATYEVSPRVADDLQVLQVGPDHCSSASPNNAAICSGSASNGSGCTTSPCSAIKSSRYASGVQR